MIIAPKSVDIIAKRLYNINMKKTLLPLILLCATFAHAEDWKNPNAPFDSNKNRVTSSTITWIPVSNIQTTCRTEYAKRGYGKLDWAVDACSFWDKNVCIVYTKMKPTLHDIGHEMRHCFQGNYH